MPQIETKAWYLLQSKPRQSERAKENLENQGFECFLPMVQVERVRQAKRSFMPEPLFPGYLFIHLSDQHDNWSPIRSTRGVARMVAFNGAPQPVQESIISTLQERTRQLPRINAYAQGDMVRITQGAFHSIEAVFQAYDGEERVILLLTMLNKQQQLHIPVQDIVKVMGA